MKIYFVRHGQPNYVDDCLTPTGLIQAEACAQRLKGEGITTLYTSPLGRAKETAACASEALGLPITTLDFMREVTWAAREGKELPFNGHPWALSSRMIMEEDWNFKDDNWREHTYFKNNIFLDCHDHVVENIDGFLKEHGFERRGTRYFCNFVSDETPAIFSHGGSSGCAISHIINLPFPYFGSYFEYDYTSVIIVEFPDRPGSYIYPRIRLFNDIAHIKKTDDAAIEYKK